MSNGCFMDLIEEENCSMCLNLEYASAILFINNVQVKMHMLNCFNENRLLNKVLI